MRNTEECTCLLSTSTVVHSYPIVFFKTLPLLDRNNHSPKYLQESAHWGDWNGTVDQIHLAKDQVHTCQIELLCLIAVKPFRENSSSPITNKMLHENQGTELCALFFWEHENVTIDQWVKALETVFSKEETKLLQEMAGEAMKLHHSQWRFCTTVKVQTAFCLDIQFHKLTEMCFRFSIHVYVSFK